MAPPATLQDRARVKAPAAFLNLPSIDELGRAGSRVVDTARNHAIEARARVLFYDKWGRANGTLRGAAEAFQAKVDEIARERDPSRARAMVRVLTEEASPPRKSRPALGPVRRIVERHPLPVRQVAYAPQGGYYNLTDMWRNFQRPFHDANVSIDREITQPVVRGTAAALRGDWNGLKREMHREIVPGLGAGMALMEGFAATPNGVINAAVRPWTDVGSDIAYNAGWGTDVSPEENRERNNQFVGTVGGVASMFAGKLPTKIPKISLSIKGLPKVRFLPELSGGRGVAWGREAVIPRVKANPSLPVVGGETRIYADMADGPAFGGNLYPPDRLRRLAGYLERRNVSLFGTEGNPGFLAKNDGTGQMVLPAKPTTLQVKHELSHYLDFRNMGFEPYRDMGRAAREASVLRRLQENRSWPTYNEAERQFSIDYVNRLKGQ